MFKASSTRRAPYKIPAQYKIQLREEIKPEIQPCSHSSGESERMAVKKPAEMFISKQKAQLARIIRQ